MTKYISTSERINNPETLTADQLRELLAKPFNHIVNRLFGTAILNSCGRFARVRDFSLLDYTRNRSTVVADTDSPQQTLAQIRWIAHYLIPLTSAGAKLSPTEQQHLNIIANTLFIQYLNLVGAEPSESWPTLTEAQWGCYLFGNYLWYSVIPHHNWFHLAKIQDFQQDYKTLDSILVEMRHRLNSDLAITNPQRFNATRRMYIALVKYQQARAMITVLEQLGTSRKYLEQDFHQLVVANPPYPLIPVEKLQLLVSHYSQALLEAIQVPDILEQYQRLLETVDFDINLSSYLE